jgi:hypothetical protein
MSGNPDMTAVYKPASRPCLDRAGRVEDATRTEAGIASKAPPGARPERFQ